MAHHEAVDLARRALGYPARRDPSAELEQILAVSGIRLRLAALDALTAGFRGTLSRAAVKLRAPGGSHGVCSHASALPWSNKPSGLSPWKPQLILSPPPTITPRQRPKFSGHSAPARDRHMNAIYIRSEPPFAELTNQNLAAPAF